MENDYTESIQNLLNSLAVLAPVETEMSVKLSPSVPVKAVIFDIYGTLLISASGDIDQASVRSEFVEQAGKATGILLSEGFIKKAFSAYRAEIKRVHQESRKRAVAHPEIDVIGIWEQVFANNQISADKKQIEEFAFIFELQSNPVYPMPEMKAVLERLRFEKLPLGIVSNAQFYTLPIMNYFLNANRLETEYVEGFNTDLCSFSFREKVAKPDVLIYKKVSNALKRDYGIMPEECLYIGNDMLRDVYPAKKIGFKAVLFAGDARSLRLRKEHKDVIGLEPDYIITELKQIFDIIES